MISYLFLSLPVIALVFFIVSLIDFLSARRQAQDGSIPSHGLKSKKTRMIVSAVIAAVLWIIVIGFVALIIMAMAYM